MNMECRNWFAAGVIIEAMQRDFIVPFHHAWRSGRGAASWIESSDEFALDPLSFSEDVVRLLKYGGLERLESTVRVLGVVSVIAEYEEQLMGETEARDLAIACLDGCRDRQMLLRLHRYIRDELDPIESSDEIDYLALGFPSGYPVLRRELLELLEHRLSAETASRDEPSPKSEVVTKTEVVDLSGCRTEKDVIGAILDQLELRPCECHGVFGRDWAGLREYFEYDPAGALPAILVVKGTDTIRQRGLDVKKRLDDCFEARRLFYPRFVVRYADERGDRGSGKTD